MNYGQQFDITKHNYVLKDNPTNLQLKTIHTPCSNEQSRIQNSLCIILKSKSHCPHPLVLLTSEGVSELGVLQCFNKLPSQANGS